MSEATAWWNAVFIVRSSPFVLGVRGSEKPAGQVDPCGGLRIIIFSPSCRFPRWLGIYNLLTDRSHTILNFPSSFPVYKFLWTEIAVHPLTYWERKLFSFHIPKLFPAASYPGPVRKGCSPFPSSFIGQKFFNSTVENTLGRACGETHKDVDISNWPRGRKEEGDSDSLSCQIPAFSLAFGIAIEVA